MIFIKIIAVILILYVIFCLGPGITAYIITFCSNNKVPNLQNNPVEHFYRGYEERYEEKLNKWHKDCTRVSVMAKDNRELYADYYRKGENKLAILMHGYRTDPYVNFAGLGSILWDLGYDLLVVYERGHFPSKGSTSMGLLEREDLIIWTEYCKKEYNPSRLIVGGVSMGAAVTAYASDRLKGVSALILDCAFLSPYNQLSGECRQRHIPPVMIMPIVRLCGLIHLKKDMKEPVTSHLAQTEVPVFITHGIEDMTVPVSVSDEIYESVRVGRKLVKAENAGHACAFIVDYDNLEKELGGFLNEFI